MKKIFVASVILCTGLVVFTSFHDNKKKMKPAIFNHMALYVADLDKSANFYQTLLELKKIDEPFKDGKHIWFNIGEHSQLHLITGTPKTQTHIRDTHLAFSVENLDEVIQRLEKQKINFNNWAGSDKAPTVRSDGVKQVYLQDPDGFWIEINDDKY